MPHEPKDFIRLVNKLDEAQIKFNQLSGALGQIPNYDGDFHKSSYLRVVDMAAFKDELDEYNLKNERVAEAAKEVTEAVEALEAWMPEQAKTVMNRHHVAISVPMPGGHAFLLKENGKYTLFKGGNERDAESAMRRRRQ